MMSMIIECLHPARMLFAESCPAMIPENEARIIPIINIWFLLCMVSKVMLNVEKLSMNMTFMAYAVKRKIPNER